MFIIKMFERAINRLLLATKHIFQKNKTKISYQKLNTRRDFKTDYLHQKLSNSQGLRKLQKMVNDCMYSILIRIRHNIKYLTLT